MPDLLGRAEPSVAQPFEAARLAYRRVLANWASDLLVEPRRVEWPAADDDADYRDRDWRRLYDGSVLDD